MLRGSLLSLLVLAGACSSPRAPLRATRALLDDPCVLVSRAEAEAILGPLDAEPFRADGRMRPDPRGATCLYRAASGQHVGMTPTFSGGAAALRALGDTLAPARGGIRSVWLPPGRLAALVDDVLLDVDVAGSTIGARGAVRFARHAVRRLDAPLPHDGAAAARAAPPPRQVARDPCGLLDPGMVEAAVGPLSGPPQRIDSTGCRYPRPRRGLVDRNVEVRFVWDDGVGWLNRAAHAADSAAPLPARAALERIEQDSLVRELLGAAGLDSAQLRELAGRGATPLDGPWDLATAVPGEFRFAKRGVGVTIIAPTSEAARRIAEQLAGRL